MASIKARNCINHQTAVNEFSLAWDVNMCRELFFGLPLPMPCYCFCFATEFSSKQTHAKMARKQEMNLFQNSCRERERERSWETRAEFSICVSDVPGGSAQLIWPMETKLLARWPTHQCEKFKLSHFVSVEQAKSIFLRDNYLVYICRRHTNNGFRNKNGNLHLRHETRASQRAELAYLDENGRRNLSKRFKMQFKFSNADRHRVVVPKRLRGCKMAQLKLCMYVRIRECFCVFAKRTHSRLHSEKMFLLFFFCFSAHYCPNYQHNWAH